ncbi:MAG: FtsH protease activity modulator HflK [Thiohalocapsa sp.]|jgi:membrane protease subunit HflK|uniref:FtsH protease activity modulator HflK n=1 Tax=Thiohalocapsa sp. TaxID=2497641 RepID=UPI0025E30E4C|nr:FtsH protease activity modulator HflK [Thiohalocapsa sp.]MCG6943235.1 FtsH protease activity modulator HflK [Thiohalocapsa sp.]
MAWNEPGGGGKDPWGNSPNNAGPPDLDEIVRKLQERVSGLLGGGKGGGAGGGGGADISRRTIGIILAVLLIAWLFTGIYIVDPAERGVVMRFGAYAKTTEPGPHWHIPYPIETVQLVNVDEISSFTHKAAMLTKDENIVDVELTVQSRIQDAANYLFQDQAPEKTLRDATETVVRKTIGGSKLDFILTEGRSAIAATIQERVQALLNGYKTGLLVTSVNMQPAKPPDAVKEAFDDAIKAREDKERLENQAEAYSNEILPRARGEAARILADAKAYRDRVIAEAEGQTARFSAVRTQYEKAPEVTRERLYIETVERVLGANNTVLLDVPGGNSLMYLPLDQLIGKPTRAQAGSNNKSSADLSQPTTVGTHSPDLRSRDVSRERRSR